MKKFIIYMICSTALSVTVSLIYAKYYLSPKLKELIQSKSAEVLGTPVQIRDLQVRILPNLSVAAGGVRFADPKRKLLIEVRRVYVTLPLSLKLLDKKNPIGPIQVSIEEPKVSFESSAPDPAKANLPAEPQPPRQISVLKFNRDLQFDIKVQKARIKLSELAFEKDAQNMVSKQIILDPLNFELQVPGMEKDWTIELKTQARISQGALNLDIPVQVKSEFSFADMVITTTQTSGDIGGIPFQVTGQQKIIDNTGNWKIDANIEDLSKLVVPPSLVPAKNWKGQIRADVRVANLDAVDWQIYADLNMKDVSADLHFEKDDLKLDGRFILDLSTKLNHLKSLKFENLNVLVNLDGVQILKEKLFSKPSGTHLSANLKSSGVADQLNIQNLDFEFANLVSTANGTIGLAKHLSDLKFNIQKTELAGWEKYSPLLKEHPLTGAVELVAKIKGYVDQPESLRIELSPLKIENLKGQIKYQTEANALKIDGPFEVDANIQTKLRGKEVDDLKLTADGNLTGMMIDYNNTFSKKANENFKFKLDAAQNDNGIQVKNAIFEILSSTVKLDAQLSHLERPKIDAHFEFLPLEIGDTLSLLPQFKAMPYRGSVRGSAHLGGIYDFKESIQKSPLTLSANLDVNMPSLEYVTSMAAEAKPKASTPTKTSNVTVKSPDEALLPNWPIFETAKVKISTKIKKVKYNELLMDELLSLLSFEQGQLLGDVKIQKLFSGQAHLYDFKTDLRKVNPEFSGQFEFTKMDSNLALSFLSSEYKNILKSDASGSIQFSTLLPSRTEFMSELKASGKVNLKNAFISSMQIDDIINDKISKIPGIGKQKPIATKGIGADISSQFSLAKALLNIIDFKMLTPEKNELQAKGSLEIASKNVNLAGTAYLANAPVGGDIKLANSDSQQRFVIPFLLQGNIMKPEASFAQKSIEEILKNTLNYVAKRETESFKKDLKDDPKKAIQNKVDQLKKGLDGLFGK